MEILVNASQAAREVAEGINTDGCMVGGREVLSVGKADNNCSPILGPQVCEELTQSCLKATELAFVGI